MKTKSSNKMKWLYSSLFFSSLMAVTILSVSPLHAKELKKINVNESITSATDALQGKITNIEIINKDNTGNTDSLQDGKKVIVIEKTTKKDGKIETIHTNTIHKPSLMIVDGLEVQSIENINPNDIESVSVLKNKSATELYGEKGKNGVVLITMKKPVKLNEIKEPVNSKVSENQTEAKDTVSIRRKIITNSKGEKQEVYIAKQNDFLQNPPLFLLDDKEITNEQMKNIATDDIQNITVLKDKSATDKYGDKVKNGVVIIHLKKCKKSEITDY